MKRKAIIVVLCSLLLAATAFGSVASPAGAPAVSSCFIFDDIVGGY